jgi:hypothetical protein
MRILTHVMHWQAIEVVIVAVNRGEVKTIALETGLNVASGQYSGPLGATSEVNEGNWLTVAPGGEGDAASRSAQCLCRALATATPINRRKHTIRYVLSRSDRSLAQIFFEVGQHPRP